MQVELHTIPAAVAPFFKELSDEQQGWFLREYQRRSRSVGWMMVLAILFPIQLFFLRKVLMGVVFLLTGGGFGIWYLVEWFLTPGRVRAYNEAVAMSLIHHLKAFS